MLKNLLPFLLLICFTAAAQTTPIPDANFEQFLVDQGIDTNGVNGNILDVDAQAVTNLNVTRNDITDFTGLEAFVNIVTLNTGGNQYPTIPLNTLTLLESFVFNRNQDLDSIDFTQNPALRSINIRSHNQPELSITTLDLSQNLNLESVTIELPSLTSLTFPITTTLVDIDTYNCSVPVIDLSQLEGDLDYYIIGSQVDVTIVYPNKRDALKILRLSSIDFPTVDVSEMIGLERLSLSSTDVETLLLPSTTTLTNLSVSHHDFGSSLDLSPVPALTSLDIRFADSPLDIDLTSSPLLRDVWLTHNMMTTVDVTQNPELNSFRIYDNELTSLNVTQNLDLFRLDAGQNQLPSIDLSLNLDLEYLRLPQNQLPVLDITNNTELRLVDIGENLFTGNGLDLTQNHQLGSLYVDNNQIESLNITQNADLYYLDISYNIFPGSDILQQFADLSSAQGRLRGALIANNNLLNGPIPDFFGLYDPMVQTRRFRLHIAENRFHFGDFESQHLDLLGLTTTMSIPPSPDWVIDQYTYAPQAKVNTIESTTRNAGESITLTTTVRGEQNHYKWFKDGAEIIDAPDEPEYTITDLNTCDAGVYHSEITSDLVPFENANAPGTNGRNLLLVRNDITLAVNATKECVTLDMPLTNVPINSGIQWNDNPGACGYKIRVGTTSGNDDLLALTDVGEVTVYNHPTDFASNQDIFVTIIPYYDDGDFSCAEQSFRTNNTTVEPECTFLSSPLDLSVNVPFDLDRLEWNPANGADEYNITITSPSGSNDIITNTTDTFLTLSNDFDEGEVVTVTIVPENSVGMASGCASESFTIQNSGGPTPPSCTNLNNPTDTTTDMAVDLASISWDAAANATQYRITIDGSTSNLNDETDLIVSGTSHSFANDFDNGETVTVTIVPLNGTVEPSTTCSSETFTIVAAAPISNAFITTWETTMANETITIPTRPFFGTYDYTVDWGDGVIDNNVAGDITHTYNTSGIQTISITGTFPQIHFNGTAVDRDKILTIEQWGDIEWQALTQAFKGCSRLTITNPSIDNPDLSNVTNISEAFADCTNFNGDITLWNVGTVTNMVNIFQRARSFNQDIGDWNVSNVIAMDRVFEGATAFNQDIGDWDVSSVTRMPVMFAGADNFNQDIGNWNVSNVTDMNTMFAYATSFNQDIGNWNVSNVTNMDQMFLGAAAFNQDISFKVGMGIPSGDAWNISNITSMVVMFSDASSFNQDISNWDVSNVTSMSQTFRDAISFDQDLSSWNVSNVNNAGNMFTGVTLSTANYDALLIGWNGQSLQPNVSFSGGNSQYCAGESARTNMTTTDMWNITDEGLAGPTVDDLTDQTQANSYTLPNITGTQLTGAEAYYTEADGGGTRYEASDIINFADFPSYPVTLYIYDGSGACASEENFQLTLTSSGPTPPICTNLNSPNDSDSDVAVDLASISWDVVANATQYRITIDGSTSDANDETDLIVSGTSHSFANDFDNGETITVTIVPLNGTVEPSTACSAETFTIISTGPTPPNCTNLNIPTDTTTDVAVDFASISWDAAANATQYRITIDGSTSDANDETDLIVSGTSHSFANDFDNGETVTVTIVPLNGTIEPNTACNSETFTISSAGPTPPSCTSLNSPTDNATDVAVDSQIEWDAVTYADGYYLSLGTESGNYNLLSNEDVGILTSYSLNEDFGFNTTIYVLVVPYSTTLGEAENCDESSFTTIQEPIVEVDDETKYGFSPDGDGINEYWHIDNIENHPQNMVTIYNRWGDAVFKIENYDNGASVFSGNANLKTKMGAGQLPAGTYFFDIQFEGESTLRKTKGYLVIKR